MMPFISTSSVISPVAAQTSSVVGSPIESVRVPAAAVTSTLNAGALHYNSSGNAPLRMTPAQVMAAATGPQPGFVMMTDTAALPSAQFSSPFMAQLLAQAASVGEAESLAAIYANDNLPTVDPKLMELFSMVKYLPSNAALPAPKPSNPLALTTPAPAQASPQQNAPQPVQQSMAVQPAVQLQQMAAATPQRIINTIQNTGGTLQPKPVASTVSDSTPAPASPRRGATSLVRQTGVDAYAASFMRNFVHLGEHINDNDASKIAAA